MKIWTDFFSMKNTQSRMLNLKFETKEEEQDFLKTRIEDVLSSQKIINKLLSKGIRTIGGIIKQNDKKLIKTLDIHLPPREKNPNLSLFEDNLGNEKEEPNFVLPDFDGEEDIISVLCGLLGFKAEDVINHSRKKETVVVRDMVMFVLREYADMSYLAIGRLLDRDHTTVLHAYNKIKNKIKKDGSVLKKLKNLIQTVELVKERKKEIAKILSSIQPLQNDPQPKFKEIPERQTKMLELYREGITFRNIGKLFGLTHERARQLVLKTVYQTAMNESVERGVLVSFDVLFEEEKKKRHDIINSKKPPKAVRTKEKRWSRYYLACVSCGTISVPHARKGHCRNCIRSFGPEKRNNTISAHNNKCDRCGMERGDAVRKFGRDFYITKNNEVLCRKCFLSEVWSKSAYSRRKRG